MKITRPQARGITLIEVVMATVTLSVVVVGALRASASSVQRRYTTLHLAHASMLADQLLAEAMSLPFQTDPELEITAEFGPSEVESAFGSWGAFDDADDLHGWSAQPPKDASGSAMPQFAMYTRSASVTYVTLRDLETTTATPTQTKRITVQIHRDGVLLYQAVGYRTAAGARSQEQ